ncbi:hypothetical protein GCM10027185_62110 [Spirosoma pulveris]
MKWMAISISYPFLILITLHKVSGCCKSQQDYEAPCRGIRFRLEKGEELATSSYLSHPIQTFATATKLMLVD